MIIKHVYNELHEIPRPEGSFLDGKRVYIVERDTENKRHKVYIGYLRDAYDNTMTPNQNFRTYFPSLWNEAYGHKMRIPERSLHFGMYASTLGICTDNGLYPILQEIYEPEFANAILDFAMYNILSHKNDALGFSSRMKREVLFSSKLQSDTDLSLLFQKHMPEDLNHQFRIKWIQNCIERGVATDVWICIDGSNNDCVVTNSGLCEKGEAKSKRNVTLVAYMYAVTADTRYPLTYTVQRGNKVDSKVFMQLCTFLRDNKLTVKGVIVDRGFVTHDCLNLIVSSGYEYVILLKGDTHAHTEFFKEEGMALRWSLENAVTRDGLFGITSSEPRKIFKAYDDVGYIHLYFDAKNGFGRAMTLLGKAFDAKEAAEEAIVAGKEYKFSKGMQEFFEIVDVPPAGDGTSAESTTKAKQVIVKSEAWKKAYMGKGFTSIATSKQMSAREANRIYHLRDASETTYAMIKTQLGADVTRVHSDESIFAKFAAGFVASIIRTEIENACSNYGYATNAMINSLDDIQLILGNGESYSAYDDTNEAQKKILKCFGINNTDFTAFADDVNQRIGNGPVSQIRRMPEEIRKRSQKKMGRPPKKDKQPVDPDAPKRKPGRPKGSKNKSTLEKEAKLKAAIEAGEIQPPEPTPKRGPGRPKGSKNKKTLQREADIEAGIIPAPEPKPERGRGRPKGSKNKKTLAREAKEEKLRRQGKLPPKEETEGPKKVGRPAGSKDRKKRKARSDRGKKHNRRNQAAEGQS